MSANISSTTPAAASGKVNVTWQKDSSGNVSAQIPRPVDAATQAANTVLAGPSSGSAATPAFRALSAADVPNIAESQVTNLTTDLAAKAPLASPTFTGTPAAPTPSTADNSTKIATTAYVQAQGFSSATQPFLIAYFLSGSPTASFAAYMEIPSNLSTVSFPANFSGSTGKCGTNPTATAVYTIAANGTTIGTVTISTSGVFTFATTGGTSKSVAASADISITAPSSADATLANVRFTLAGTR